MFNPFRRKKLPALIQVEPTLVQPTLVQPSGPSELSEALRLDVKELYEAILLPASDNQMWLGRRCAILVPMLPLIIFLEAAKFSYTLQDLIDLDSLDNLMLRARNTFGHAALTAQNDLAKNLLNIPCYDPLQKGHQSIIAKQNYSFVIMCTRHLNGRLD